VVEQRERIHKMPKCSFCGKDYDIPRGVTFVLTNGDILYFCSSKCQKNKKLGRKAEKRNWIRKLKKSGSEVVEKK
jgi:large subunit ribosomal protein L24e